MARPKMKSALEIDSDISIPETRIIPEIPAEIPRAQAKEAQRELKPGEAFTPDGEIVSRQRTGFTDPYFIPLHLKGQLKDYGFVENGKPVMLPEWDLQWNTYSVYNQVDPTRSQTHAMNGWRPVMTKPGDKWSNIWTPPDHSGAIIVGGLRLEIRSQTLSVQARQEERRKAQQQVKDNAQSRGMNIPMPTGFSTDNHTLNQINEQRTKVSLEPGPARAKHPLAID